MITKNKPFRSRKLTQAAEGQSCIRCGTLDGTVVSCHYQGLGSPRLGKGKGIKPHDFAAADLCMSCHSYLDRYDELNDTDRGWEFLMLCMETLARRFNDEVISVTRRK